MMDVFRGSKKLVAVVFALLMLIFVLTSVDLSTMSGSNTVGKIDGRSIDARTYETLVQQQVEATQRQGGGSLSLEEMQQIRDQVWEQLVQTSVLEKEYERRDIDATDDEVVEWLRFNPPAEVMRSTEFQSNGQFDVAKYQRWLGSAAADQVVPYLEAQAREDIRRAKLFRVVTADVYLSDAALWQHYRDRHETVTMGLTPILPRNAVPDSMVKVTPAEVEAYYKANPGEFERPATAHLSYVALPRLITQADTLAARQRAEELRKEIVGGAPFGEVAGRESADSVSGANGGDLGWFKKAQMDPAFGEAAFTLPLKTLSEPVLSSFGWHVLEVTARQGDSAQARHILVPIELSGPNRDRFDARADTLERLAAEQTDPAALDSASRALGLRVGKAQPTQQGGRTQVGPLVVPDAGVWAFQAQEGETSPLIETTSALFVFRVDSVQKAGVPALASIRPGVESRVRERKKADLARRIAADFLKRVEGGATMEATAKAMSLPYRVFGPYTRTEPPLPNPAIVGAAFGLPKGARSKVLETGEGMYVLEVIERAPADSAAFVKELDELRADAVRAARADRVRAFMAGLRQQADVVDRRAELYRTNLQAQQQTTPAGI